MIIQRKGHSSEVVNSGSDNEIITLIYYKVKRSEECD